MSDRLLTSPVNALTKVFFLSGFALLVAVRLPDVFLRGRFWAEEGSIYFTNAWKLPFFEALVASAPADYWNLIASAATLCAAYTVALEHAPLVTASIALVVQSLPALLILTSRMRWTQQPLIMVAALLIIAMPPACEETWVNSINGQHHLALSVGIILALDTEKGATRLLHFFILSLAVLSSPGSWFLMPLFGLRAVLERSRPRAMQTFILLAGFCLQFGIFFVSYGRTFGMHPSLLGAIILVKHAALPLFGPDLTRAIATRIAALFSDGEGPLWPLVIAISLLAGLLACALRAPKAPPLWFLLGATVLAIGSYLSAFGDKTLLLSGGNGARYQMAPHVLLMLSILSWAAVGIGRTRFAAAMVVMWALIIQVPSYFHPPAVFAVGPDWQEDVLLRKVDPQHFLRIWPAEMGMQL